MPTKLDNTVFIEHYVAQIWGVDKTILNNKKDLLIKAKLIAKDLKITVVKSFIHQFKPHGLSLILVISESHLAIHTWPEFSYLNIDVLSCSRKTNLSNLLKILEQEFIDSTIICQKVEY